jgi:hypothetical protein
MGTDLPNPGDGYFPGSKSDGNNTFYTQKNSWHDGQGKVGGALYRDAATAIWSNKTPMNCQKIKEDQGRSRRKICALWGGFLTQRRDEAKAQRIF